MEKCTPSPFEFWQTSIQKGHFCNKRAHGFFFKAPVRNSSRKEKKRNSKITRWRLSFRTTPVAALEWNSCKKGGGLISCCNNKAREMMKKCNARLNYCFGHWTDFLLTISKTSLVFKAAEILSGGKYLATSVIMWHVQASENCKISANIWCETWL